MNDGGRYVLDGAEWRLVDPNGLQRHRLAAATNLLATAALTEAGLPTGLDAEKLLRSPPDDAADWRSEAARVGAVAIVRELQSNGSLSADEAAAAAQVIRDAG